MTVDHVCKNRSCANPKHLELKTRGDNVRAGNTIASRNLKRLIAHKGMNIHQKILIFLNVVTGIAEFVLKLDKKNIERLARYLNVVLNIE